VSRSAGSPATSATSLSSAACRPYRARQSPRSRLRAHPPTPTTARYYRVSRIRGLTPTASPCQFLQVPCRRHDDRNRRCRPSPGVSVAGRAGTRRPSNHHAADVGQRDDVHDCHGLGLDVGGSLGQRDVPSVSSTAATTTVATSCTRPRRRRHRSSVSPAAAASPHLRQ
jgi:hypothetical protein